MNINITSIIAYTFFSLYKMASSVLPCSCRYYPTCSEYSRNAICKHGFIRGIFLTLKRVLRCNPFFTGGYDPVE